ncbi:hypothetical protein T484DRAFT_1802843 [Baffinella frigidus]|nr:hypothetical protein T484DRAFT_1802843 [Cryptophyta sp. CCMP2293]
MPRLARLLAAALLTASAAGAAEVADHDREHAAREHILAAARNPAEPGGELPSWYGDRRRVGPEDSMSVECVA